MPSPRIASWIYDVINVLIDALEAECRLLGRHNLTWRFHDKRLEHLWPIAGYLTHNGRHILTDVMKERPVLLERVLEHDRRRNELEVKSSVFHQTIIDSPGFVEAVQSARAVYVARDPNARPEGAFTEVQLPALVAQHLVNRVGELPTHYTDAAFWNMARGELARYVPAYADIDVAELSLLDYNNEMKRWLVDVRLDLCREYDLPAAPSGSVGH